MLPNKKNFCGGNFQDWLEVNLIEKCNAKCEWCVEKRGYHPIGHANWAEILYKILGTKKQNILLLGGEPTLYPYLENIIRNLWCNKRNVFMTTNGINLTHEFIKQNLVGLSGINISVHDYDLWENYKIFQCGPDCFDHEARFRENITSLTFFNIKVRLNCNCIKGHIDSIEKIHNYICFAKEVGADSVRFSELITDDENLFVDLAKLFRNKYGLNENPLSLGCHQETIIDGMPVTFKQMCGHLIPKFRKAGEYEFKFHKQILYYDGNIYNGWQVINKGWDVAYNDRVMKILKDVERGEITSEQALLQIKQIVPEESLQFGINPCDGGGPGNPCDAVRSDAQLREFRVSGHPCGW